MQVEQLLCWLCKQSSFALQTKTHCCILIFRTGIWVAAIKLMSEVWNQYALGNMTNLAKVHFIFEYFYANYILKKKTMYLFLG